LIFIRFLQTIDSYSFFTEYTLPLKQPFLWIRGGLRHNSWPESIREQPSPVKPGSGY